MKKGRFITVEGIDGAGKSSHIDFLIQYFKNQGHEVVFTREPGGPAVSEKLREILLHDEMSVDTEVLLMFAARQENISACIKPALKAGKVVICDRFTDSTFAYQGGGRGYSFDRLKKIADWVHQGLEPDLTLLFDLPFEVAKTRLASHQSDRFEKENERFFNQVRKTYLSLVKESPNRFILVDSTDTIENIQSQLKIILNKKIGQWL